MRSFTYPVHLEPSLEGGFVVTCRDVPETITQGDSLQEALDEAADALDEALQGRIEDGEDVPPASRARKNEYLVAPPVGTALKLAVYLALRDTKISRSELAHRLDVDEKEIRRVLDPKHQTKANRLEAVLRTLGRRVDVSVV
jgi:antitoxin HicB